MVESPSHLSLRPTVPNYQAVAESVFASLKRLLPELETASKSGAADEYHGHYCLLLAGRKVFGRAPSSSRQEYLRLSLPLLEKLRQQNFPTAKLLRPSQPLAGGLELFIFEWSNGIFFTEQEKQLRSLVSWTSELHNRLRAEDIRDRQLLSDIYLPEIARQVTYEPPYQQLQQDILRDWDRLKVLLDEGAQTIHGDIHRGNVLFAENGQLDLLLDFEEAVRFCGSRLVDLSWIFERFVLVSSRTTDLQDQWTQILELYNQRSFSPMQPDFLDMIDIIKVRCMHALGLCEAYRELNKQIYQAETQKFYFILERCQRVSELPGVLPL